jgi:hypothetical protein
LPPEQALRRPASQSETDQGYERRDLVFENRAVEGFWAEAKHEYDAAGVIFDAKNYGSEIDGSVVRDVSKYLKEYGLGRLGVVVAREVPTEARAPATRSTRIPSAVEEQKTQWRDPPRKMIILLSEDDLVEMLTLKANGRDPTDLLRDRVYALKARM